MNRLVPLFAPALAVAACLATMTAAQAAPETSAFWPQPGTFLVPASDEDVPATRGHLQTAIFAGGCFWGVQGLFQHVEGDTGHAESVEVVYDSSKVSYVQLLRVFFSAGLDATEVNQQYPDRGTQYRLVLFTRTAEQASVARACIAKLDARKVYARPIATAIVPDQGFHAAESHHQNFLALSHDNPYVAAYDQPKLRALQSLLPAEWRDQPVLTLAADTHRS